MSEDNRESQPYYQYMKKYIQVLKNVSDEEIIATQNIQRDALKAKYGEDIKIIDKDDILEYRNKLKILESNIDNHWEFIKRASLVNPECESISAIENLRNIMFMRFFNQRQADQLSTGSMDILHGILAADIAFSENSTKIIQIEEDLFQMIKETKNSIFYRPTPFQNMYINKNIRIDENVLIHGIISTTVYEDINYRGEEHKKCNYLAIIGRDKRDNSELFMSWKINENGIDIQRIKEKNLVQILPEHEDKKVRKIISEIFANVIDFMNHPKIKMIHRNLSYNSINRINRGKIPYNDEVILSAEKLLEDQSVITKSHLGQGYRFSVRGHYVHFRNKIRFKNLYKLTIVELGEKDYQIDTFGLISKWVKQYYKGDGPLVNKSYRLKK